MLRHLPNALTLGNLFCGCCALLLVLHGRIPEAALFTIACFVLDYADGMVARALGVAGPLGKQLDSLADVVSFGVVPGAMIYHLLQNALGGAAWTGYPTNGLLPEVAWGALPAFVLSAFAGLRLGRFNLDTRQTSYFIGLSTPAVTVFVLGLTLASESNRFGINAWLLQPVVLYLLIGLLSFLMNANLPLFGLKLRGQAWWRPALFFVLFVVLVFWLRELAFSAVVLCYVLASLFWPGAVTED